MELELPWPKSELKRSVSVFGDIYTSVDNSTKIRVSGDQMGMLCKGDSTGLS